MARFAPSPEQVAQFGDDGYLSVPALFESEETGLLRAIARSAQEFTAGAYDRKDSQGGNTRLAVSNDLSDDIFSAVVRCERVARSMKTLFGDEVYHYHHKMTMKEPYTGGAWEWHQDYGYWYNNGCLYPDMGSCYIAVDAATVENGCLQVIRGSHKMGRIDHGKAGDQTGADMERVNAALERMELVFVEMEPGDAIFFHGNLLHRSDQNRSPNPRWGFICCYNTRHNDPYKESRHPRYSPLEILPDSAVREAGERQIGHPRVTA